MDHSPGELEGEIDHLSKDAAIEYLLMPERVKKLEGQILGLSSQIEDLRSDVSRLVQVLKEAITPKENYSSPLKDEKYIS
jgi:prophage DNA circulation protein